MRVGIFGGTFDPVHMGHLRVAEEVRVDFSLDRVYFVPAFAQPLKRQKEAASAEDRLRMLNNALRGNSFFKVSDIEIRRGGISYSIDTIRTFSKRFEEMFFILGADAFSDIGLWRSHEELFGLANFVVMMRPGRRIEDMPKAIKDQTRSLDGATWVHASGKRIYFRVITQLDISSTRIREFSGKGRSIKYLVPRSVERYIVEKGLYRR
jgi:nicotinate-nucleotide adenylyltransferase